MIKIIFVTCIFSISYCVVIAQTGWDTQYQNVTVNDFNSVYFTDINTGWVVGDGGVILHTVNGGTNWAEQISGTYENLNSVFFIDQNTGWAVGHNFKIIKTTNGGITWFSQNNGTCCNFYSVFFVNQNVGWVSGDQGKILKTTDGGSTWTIQYINTFYGMTSIEFVNEHIGWATGAQQIGLNNYGIILKTTNGGIDWVIQHSTNYMIYASYFLNDQLGWAVGSNSKAFRTTDSGNNWTTSIFSPYEDIGRSVFFTNVSNGWLAAGYLHYSTNGGVNWVKIDLGTNIMLNDVFFCDSLIGYAVGSHGVIVKTTNGGGIVPVEMTSFTAYYVNTNVYLNWSTASELNNRGFEIERSTNKTDWRLIGFKEGNGTTTETHNYSFVNDLYGISSSKLYYRLKQIDFNGSFEYSEIVEVETAPSTYSLEQNYPNPFNPSTKISWQSPVGSWQTLKIYDVLGREVATLVDGFRIAGSYEVEFNPESSIKNPASGIYFYQLKAGDFIETKKMILMK